MNICVYCASSAGVNTAYFEATERLAKEFVKAKVNVVYGGGAIGLMGRLADAIITEGGKIKGVIPRFMDEVEWTHPRLTEVVLVDTMHQRKATFLENVDAIVALPGGTGTMEELLEVITLKRLGLFTKPIVILNTNGYYDPLKTMLERCVTERFMNDKHLAMWAFVARPEDVLPTIRQTPEWDKKAIRFAVVQ